MSKQIEIELGKKAVSDAIKELRKYKLFLIRRNRSIVYHLMQAGWEAVQSSIKTAQTDVPDQTRSVGRKFELPNTNFRGEIVEGQMIASSPKIMFWEFGAGIHYNTPVDTTPHPKGTEYGGKLGVDITIGNYSHGINGHSHGQFDTWHYGGEEVHGTEAAMPMYNAWKYMREKYVSIATNIMSQGNLYNSGGD